MRILVVEDNASMAVLLGRRLSEHGYAVDIAGNWHDALAILGVASFDLVILDLSLPDGDGRDLLRVLRQRGESVAVLVVTARGDLLERVRTLDEGADDYLVKPFSPDELLARVRALLRRPRAALDAVLIAGNVTLDQARMAVTVEGVAIDMPRREFTVLAVLLREQDRLVPRQKLEEAVYSLDDEVTPNALEVAVSRLRRRLDQHGASVSLTTMRGLGYILTGRT